jgi:hypothetical protein
MSVTIDPIETHEEYLVNGKVIYKDGWGKWFCSQGLTSQEQKAFENYKRAVIDNPRFKKHTKATYKG